jgi:hypothetical protein
VRPPRGKGVPARLKEGVSKLLLTAVGRSPTAAIADDELPLAMSMAAYVAYGQARQRLPIDPARMAAAATAGQQPLPAPLQPQVKVFPLQTPAQRRDFDQAINGGNGNNPHPWYRCLGLLYGQGAATAVVELYYVCLDHRSEFASFHAHLDAPRRAATVRVHFFSLPLSRAQLVDLRAVEGACESYLGYIVCREGDLPLVGRTLLKSPSYLGQPDESLTLVSEIVNFLGQKLTVSGVPFMQQDERFAVCAHVAIWLTHYAAFRRGLAERRLIAEFVGQRANTLDLRPGIASGLTRSEAALLYERVGLRAHLVNSPLSSTQDAPPLPLAMIPTGKQLMAALLATGTNFEELESAEHDVYFFLLSNEALVARRVDEALRSGNKAKIISATSVEDSLYALADAAVLRMLQPFLRSGFAVYAASRYHAVVLCGWGHSADGRPLVVLQDDSVGPYLVSDKLARMSWGDLRTQADLPTSLTATGYVPVDRTKDLVEGRRSFTTADTERALQYYYVPLPAGVLLNPIEAEGNALIRLAALFDSAKSDELAGRLRSTVMMGIDYKVQRREQALTRRDTEAVTVFSSVHLAEWVVIVELLEQLGSTTAVADLVYDASSGQNAPRLQLMRVRRTIVANDPTVAASSGRTLGATVAEGRFGLIEPPLRVGKVSTGTT